MKAEPSERELEKLKSEYQNERHARPTSELRRTIMLDQIDRLEDEVREAEIEDTEDDVSGCSRYDQEYVRDFDRQLSLALCG